MTEAPRRLHPASMFIDMLRSLPQTLIGLPALAGFVGRFGWGRVLLVAAAGMLLSALIAWIKWRRFTYAIVDEAVVIESGLLSRNRRILPLDRVQDVDIERKLLQRLLGLAKVSLETGGAGKDEATLDSVSLREAERLRAVIRAEAAAGAGGAVASGPSDDGPVAAPQEARALFAMGLPRLLLFGLFSFSLVWMAVLFGALQYVDNFVGDMIPSNVRIDRSRITVQAAALIGLTLLGGFAVLGFAAGIVSTVLRDAGFVLTDEGGRLRRVRGLLTRTEAVVALRRVQLAMIRTGPLRAAFGWAGLSLQTLGGSSDKGGRQDVAPFARADEIDRVLAVTPMRRVSLDQLQRVSSAHVLRALLRLAVPIGLLVGIGSAFDLALPALALAPLLVVRALLTRRFHRYAHVDGQLSIHRGVIGRRLWLIPERHVQVVTIRRSWLQRRLGSATLTPDTAGGGGAARISDITAAGAWQMAARLGEARRPVPSDLPRSSA